MSTIWKILFGLALALPLSAFVAGVLVASSAEEPAPRETIVIQDSRASTSSQAPREGRSEEKPKPDQPTARPDDPDDPPDNGEDDDDGVDGPGSTGGTVEVVEPEPETVGDDTRGDVDDNSGPGGGGPETRDDGGDDRSGPGGDDGDDTREGGDDD